MSSYSHDIEVRIIPRGDATVVEIVGNVDTMTADDLLAALRGAVGDGHVRLVGDMSGVGYTSSAGLRALLGAMKETRRGGGDLRLAAVGERVHKVLELSGFTSILQLYPDVDAALASYAS